MTEKISVIIPVYNVENQLQTCLDSVLGQTYQNLEIILINYGSIDDSDAICRSYAARDSRILYFKKDNGGLSDARHIGIRQAKGAVRLTAQVRCGWWFTYSYECISPNVCCG